MSIEYKTRRFTVDEYERMAELEIIGPDERVELIDGEIVAMSPSGDPHNSGIARVTRRLVQRFPEPYVIFVQLPMRIGDWSLPQPDAIVLRERADEYSQRRARPKDVVLLVEVAVSSLRYDRLKKGRLYAQAGVPEYWIVDVPERLVQVYTQPQAEGFGRLEVARPGEVIPSPATRHAPVMAEDVLPPDLPGLDFTE